MQTYGCKLLPFKLLIILNTCMAYKGNGRGEFVYIFAGDFVLKDSYEGYSKLWLGSFAFSK